jgi:hypothetical protein
LVVYAVDTEKKRVKYDADGILNLNWQYRENEVETALLYIASRDDN